MLSNHPAGRSVLIGVTLIWCVLSFGRQQAETQLLRPRSAEGDGIYVNSVRLLIDGSLAGEGSPREGGASISWEGEETRFIIDLGREYVLVGILIQADDNDDYRVDSSLDGETYQPFVYFRAEYGENGIGLDTMSSLPDDPNYEPMPEIPAVNARYIRLTAGGGDGLFGVSEIQAFGYETDTFSEESGEVGPFLLPRQVQGVGLYSNSPELLMDGRIPSQGEVPNANTCVFWTELDTHFIVDLGSETEIADLVVQLDGDDAYRIEYSLDGQYYLPFLEITPADGEIAEGMDTLSSIADTPDFIPELDFFPIRARYIKVFASGGNGWFALSELQLFGRREE